MLWLVAVFDHLGFVLVNFLKLEDIYCLFLTSRGFNAFLHHLLDGIAHSNKKTVGSQPSFDGRLTSYVRLMFPDVPSCFSYCLHAGINAGNIFDLAKIAYFKPLHEIRIYIGDGSSSSEFFKLLSDFNKRHQEKLREKQLGKRNTKSSSSLNTFRLMMDSRCDGYYYLYTIGCVFQNLVELDLVDTENFTSVTETESLVQSFASFANLRSLNITGNFDIRLERFFYKRSVEIFNCCLIKFYVQHNNKINNTFFDMLTTFARNLQFVSIFDCSNVTINCLTFLSRCLLISFVQVPRSFSDDVNIQAFTTKIRKACIITFH
jgi:hypothetical protein